MALPSPLRVLSLCSGIGGLDLALRLAIGPAGVHTVGYVEREAYAAAVLVARMEDEALDRAPIWDDLATFDGRPWRGAVDLVVAGFPCQPWSNAGKRLGTGDERWLWPLIERIIREVGPSYVFLENVPGLVSGGGLGEVLGGLASLGFDAEWTVLGAEDVGAPHRRDRVFILAHRNGGGGDRLHERDQSRHLEADPSGCGPRSATSEVGLPNGDGLSGPGLRSPGLAGFDEEEAGPQPLSDGRGHLADPYGEGLGSSWGEGVNRAGNEGRKHLVVSSGLAYPDRLGRPGRPSERGDDGAEQSSPQRGRGEWLENPERNDGPSRPGIGGILPKANGGGCEVQTDTRRPSQGWPPGPEDREGWNALLYRHPELAPALPAVRGVADGAAPRVDRLRALGNGVVPAQAAFAFRVLWGRLV